MLYCTLTVQLMDQSVEAVKKHMQGKKFIRAKGRSNEAAIVMRSSSLVYSIHYLTAGSLLAASGNG